MINWRGMAGAGGVAAVISMATPFIAQWEGKRNAAYLDTLASPAIWTVCYGHTGRYAYQGAYYSDAQCAEILKQDVGMHWEGLSKCISRDDVPVSVQASALELAFNVGVGAACKSTMVRRINSGKWMDACGELGKWVKAAGRTVRGLVNRRNASEEMCLKDVVG